MKYRLNWRWLAAMAANGVIWLVKYLNGSRNMWQSNPASSGASALA